MKYRVPTGHGISGIYNAIYIFSILFFVCHLKFYFAFNKMYFFYTLLFYHIVSCALCIVMLSLFFTAILYFFHLLQAIKCGHQAVFFCSVLFQSLLNFVDKISDYYGLKRLPFSQQM